MGRVVQAGVFRENATSAPRQPRVCGTQRQRKPAPPLQSRKDGPPRRDVGVEDRPPATPIKLVECPLRGLQFSVCVRTDLAVQVQFFVLWHVPFHGVTSYCWNITATQYSIPSLMLAGLWQPRHFPPPSRHPHLTWNGTEWDTGSPLTTKFKL